MTRKTYSAVTASDPAVVHNLYRARWQAERGVWCAVVVAKNAAQAAARVRAAALGGPTPSVAIIARDVGGLRFFGSHAPYVELLVFSN